MCGPPIRFLLTNLYSLGVQVDIVISYVADATIWRFLIRSQGNNQVTCHERSRKIKWRWIKCCFCQISVLLASAVWPSEVKIPQGWTPFYCNVLSLLFTTVTSRQMVDNFKGLSIRLACVLQSTEADTYLAAGDWLQHCVPIVKGSYLSLGSTAASCQRQFRRNKKSKWMTVVSVALGILRGIEEKDSKCFVAARNQKRWIFCLPLALFKKTCLFLAHLT